MEHLVESLTKLLLGDRRSQLGLLWVLTGKTYATRPDTLFLNPWLAAIFYVFGTGALYLAACYRSLIRSFGSGAPGSGAWLERRCEKA